MGGFYLYVTVHEYKHYAGGGTGLRSLLDAYVSLRRHGDGMDMAYIAAEAEKLGIAEFDVETFISAGIASKGELVKVLGNGEITAKVEVKANAFSKSAIEKIEAAGGKATVIE